MKGPALAPFTILPYRRPASTDSGDFDHVVEGRLTSAAVVSLASTDVGHGADSQRFRAKSSAATP